MSNKPLHIGEEAAVQMPMKTVVSLIIIVALGTMGYFNMVERLNQHSTRLELMEKDLTENTDFRIKWPRGQLGSLPADSEQFMLIEDLYKQVEKLQQNIEMNMSNKLKIEFMEGQISKLLEDVEKLKDANREIVYKNGNGSYAQ
jgi:uncharacterized protein HemX